MVLPLCMLQADVLRVKGAMGKTNKSVLTQVAAAVESSQWYSMRLQDYLDHLPAMLEKGHLVAKFSSRLDAMHMPSECISELHDMVKEVAVLSQCLRAGSTSDLQDQLLNKLRKLWSQIEDSPGSSVNPKVLQQVSSLFSDASLVFPMDSSIAAITLACGEMLYSTLFDVNSFLNLGKVTYIFWFFC